MKRVLTVFVSVAFIFVSSFASAESDAPPKSFTATELVEQGRFDLAISVLQADVSAPGLTLEQRGRAYALLGFAYKEQGNFMLAGRAFDHALRLMEKAGDRSNDYAATLDFYSSALMSTGDLGAAAKALHEATAAYERLGNHEALSRVHVHAAELAIERGKHKQAREELAGARAEALVANADPDLMSQIDGTAGWLAIASGRFHEGVEAYSTSLDECRRQSGENSAATGWSYLLLGKAEELDHDYAGAARTMDKGLEILKQTVGASSIRYLAGELAYSELLEHAGSHAEAVRISSETNREIRTLGLQQCAACTVSVWSLRHEER